jgi:hypothetical protein
MRCCNYNCCKIINIAIFFRVYVVMTVKFRMSVSSDDRKKLDGIWYMLQSYQCLTGYFLTINANVQVHFMWKKPAV